MHKPPERYGKPAIAAHTRRRVTIGLAVLVVTAGLGAAAVGYQRYERTAVEGKAAAFERLDDRSLSITLSVTRKDPGTPVVCIVRARSRDGAETGRREVLVGPSDAGTVQVTTTVTGFRSSEVADVYGCGTEVPAYLSGS